VKTNQIHAEQHLSHLSMCVIKLNRLHKNLEHLKTNG